jgi:hypothetical protein
LGFQIPPIFCISQPCSPPSLKKNLNFFFGFSDPANFLHQPASSKKNLNFFFGFSDPANFRHQPASSAPFSQLAPSKRILVFFLGFQIPPIFCISQLAPEPPALKKNLNFFFGFSDPANFLHQPASSAPFASYRSSLKKNLNFFFGFSDPANFLHKPAMFPSVRPSIRILIFFLGFQIPPIFCIS